MNILKKIAAIFLIILGTTLAIITLVSSLNITSDITNRIRENTSNGIGYAIGSLIGIAIFIAISFFTVKFGLKLIKNKKPNQNSYSEVD